MTIENQFDRIAAALEGIATRIDALGAAIAALDRAPTSTPAKIEQLAEALQAAAVAVDARSEESPAAEPKKRGRPALKAVETAPAPEPAPVVATPVPEPEPEAAPVVATPVPEAAPAITADDVKDAILAYAGQHGKAAALAILERHGAARVRDLDPSTYGAVLADIKKG